MPLRLSIYLGVTAPTIQVDRFRHPHVTDLPQLLSQQIANEIYKEAGSEPILKRIDLAAILDSVQGR